MLLIIGPDQNAEDIVLAVHEEEKFPDVIEAIDIHAYYPTATKLLFVHPIGSGLHGEPDPEPTFTTVQAEFHRHKRVFRKNLRAHMDALVSGQSGSEELQWFAQSAGQIMTKVVRFDYEVPTDEYVIQFSNAQTQNCSGQNIKEQRNTGFQVEVTATASGNCGIRFDWAIDLT